MVNEGSFCDTLTRMIENDQLVVKLAELEGKIDATYDMARKTYRIMWWTGAVTVAAIAISVVIFPFVLPAFFAAEGVQLPDMQGL
jgi:hypothetical protein